MTTQSDCTEYPLKLRTVTLQDNHRRRHCAELHCDENELRKHLIEVFKYNETDASTLTRQIVTNLSIERDVEDEPLQLTNKDIPAELFRVIIRCISPAQRYKILSNSTLCGVTALSQYTEWKRDDIVEIILDSINEDECYNLLKGSCWIIGTTALKSACKSGNTELVKIIKRHVSKDNWYKLLVQKHSASLFSSPLQLAVSGGHIDIMEYIKASVTAEQWYELLKSGFRKKAIHTAASECNTEGMMFIYRSVTAEQWYELLQLKSWFNNTALHKAASKGHTEVMMFIHPSVTAKQWYALLQIKNEHEFTALNIAASEGHTDVIDFIRETLPTVKWMNLLTVPSPPPWTVGMVPFRNYTKRIEDFVRIETKVQLATNASAEQGQRSQLIQELQEQEPLTMADVQRLSPHSINYIIPYNQKKSKRIGLILFSSRHRRGAGDEADKLDRSLNAAGCDQVFKLEWCQAEELENMIDSSVADMKDSCSLLIVCVMSHGSRGCVQSGQGEFIPVNKILHQLTLALPDHVPLIVLVQACQRAAEHTKQQLQPIDITGSESDPATPTQVSDPHNNQHITLTRPHTVLLLSTIRGRKAKRGLFTGAMADEFRSADGKQDIHAMFIKAHDAMKRNNPKAVDRYPEYRTTTQKFLILPPAK